MPNSGDIVEHARKLRQDLNDELPNGVGNTIDALCDKLAALSSLPQEDDRELRPWTYVHRYPGPNGSSFIRYSTNGSEINGSKPIEAIPLYGPEAKTRITQLSRDVDLLREQRPTEAMIEAGSDAALADPSIRLDIDGVGLKQSGFIERIAMRRAAVSSGISEQGEM
jgi:hypothetical protein